MSFGGRPTSIIARPIANDGFWPDLDVAQFQRTYRVPAEYLEELLVEGISLAMGEVNLDLAKRKAAWQAVGIDQVEQADPMILPERSFFSSSYKRAVYCRANAYPGQACTDRQAKRLRRLGFRVRQTGRKALSRPSIAWIQAHISASQAGLLIRALRGEAPGPSQWDIRLPKRAFLGVSHQDAQSMLTREQAELVLRCYRWSWRAASLVPVKNYHQQEPFPLKNPP